MKNKKRAISILFIAVSILIFIFFSIENKINSTNDVIYIDRNIIKTESNSSDIDKKIYTMPRLSFSYDKPEFLAYQINYKSIAINVYNINSFQLLHSKSIYIDDLITLSSFDDNFLYYINNKNIFLKINRKTLEIEKIKDSVYNAFPINEKHFIIFSNIKEKDKYNIGIYKLDFKNKLNSILINQSDTIYKNENILLYDGYFTQHENGYFSYTYYNIPKIVLFNSDLTYIKSFVLSDQTTAPTFYSINNNFILPQGSKSFTKGVCLDNSRKKLVVFSNYYYKYDYGILLDYYSLENGRYENSKLIVMKNQKINNSYIQKVYSKDKIKIFSFGDIVNI